MYCLLLNWLTATMLASFMFSYFSTRFRLVQRTGQACTALAFNLRRTTEYLVALADYSIKCFDKGSNIAETLLTIYWYWLVC